jgi:5-methylcytosine-specific restriction endonuclease McrA
MNIDWIGRYFNSEEDIIYNPIKYKKSKIPKSLYKKLYDRDIGELNYVGCCFVCKSQINRDTAHAGHVIPEYKGGETTLNNLKAICSTCNLSMGTQDLYDYKKKYFK